MQVTCRALRLVSEESYFMRKRVVWPKPEHELEYSVRMAIGLARGFYENVRITNGQLHVDVNNLNKSTPDFGHMLYRALHGHVDAAKVMDEGKKIVD
ncbi:hypothetical protein DdX_19918 [Ditylenchus destructor]|uniref:Uncharacterized protein n=1 Tax=Ditylenchus destructor TaxID=166010 RepID=A0AAD4MHL5_9BILA|nr:hypothetical protein DdX_19918 [Ditylenchus destructor]